MNNKLLVVEDEAGLVTTLQDRLAAEGYRVEVAQDGGEGLERGLEQRYDLILLDIMLPGRSGFDICTNLRRQGVNVPIIMLTAKDQIPDKILAFKMGADDYVTKPFEMQELLARIEAQLRRTNGTASKHAGVYEIGPLRVDFRRMEIWRNEQQITLSAREFNLLRYLVEHRGTTISRDELLRNVWGYRATGQTRTVDVHVSWLRQKLEDDPKNPKYIVTVPGFGYRLEV